MNCPTSCVFAVLLAPTVEYGVNVETERGFAGNASLRKKTLHRMLNDILDAWELTGFGSSFCYGSRARPAPGGDVHGGHVGGKGPCRRHIRH
jgi:hypothetical protein